MIIIAIILLIFSISNLLGVFIYNGEDDYSNLPISKEILDPIGKGWIGIASLCGVICSIFILLL